MSFEALTAPLQSMPWWAPGVIVLIFGLLTCFSGYKVLKVVLFLLGFHAGAYGALYYGPSMFPEQPIVVWSLALVLGLALGFLINFFYRAGIFVLGAYVGGMLSLTLVQSLPDVAALTLFVVAALAGGFIGLRLERWTVKIATAAIGAWHALQSIFYLLQLSPSLFPWMQVFDEDSGISLNDFTDRPWYFWVGVIGLFIVGMRMQIGSARGKNRS